MEPSQRRRAATPPTLLALLAVSLTGCGSCAWTTATPAAPPAPYDLGLLPASLGIAWPAQPEVDREVALDSADDVANGYFESNTRLRIRVDLDELVIDADDVIVAPDPGVRVRSVRVRRGNRRLRFEGGRYGEVAFESPHVISTPSGWRSEGEITDVTFSSVIVRGGSFGLVVRGRRVAVLHSDLSSSSTALFVGDTTPVPSSDIIVADSALSGGGGAATLVINQAERSVVVDSWIENHATYGYVISGEADAAFARGNTFVGGGASVGDRPSSRVLRAWLLANTFYQSGPLLGLDPGQLEELTLVGNRVYSDRVRCAWCAPTPPWWNVGANSVLAYRAPPSAPVRP